MTSADKSDEYRAFKIKLNDLIASIQDLVQSEWEEAINLIYQELSFAIKTFMNDLTQYNCSSKDAFLAPLLSKPGVLKMEKPDETNFSTVSTETFLSEDVSNVDIYYKRHNMQEKESNISDDIDKDHLNQLNQQADIDLSFKNNFIEVIKSTTNDSPEPVTYSILNLCSKNKFYAEKKNNNSQEGLVFGSTIYKKKCEEVDTQVIQNEKDEGKIQLPHVESCHEKLSSDDYSHYDIYNQSSSDHPKVYICNTEPICSNFNDNASSNQKRGDSMDIKSKSTEISLWKFQPDICPEFHSNLVENLDLFNVNFNKPDGTDHSTDLLSLKDQNKCGNNDNLEADSFIYDFSNNFSEMSTCKGSTYNITALNLINRKEADKEHDLSKATYETPLKTTITAPLSCLNCKSEIYDSSAFNRHQLNCLTNRFVCVHCHIQFNNRMTFLKHLASHDRNKCKKCPAMFCRYANLRQHMEENHNIVLAKKIYPCQYCTRSFYKPASLFHHYKLHAVKNQKVCEKCGTFCENESDFKLHMSHHMNTGLQCIKCNEIFLRKQQYEKHLQAHENYKCDYCTRAFSCKRKLYKHCKLEHRLKPKRVKLDKQYPCDQCKKIFTRPSYLSLHKKTHSGIKPLECPLCGKRFNERRILQKHYSSFLHQYNVFINDKVGLNEGDTYFSCIYCQLKLPSEKMLQFHCDLVHKAKQQKKCLKCDFRAASKEELKKHSTCHIKKLFMCEICGKGFSTYSILKDHHLYLHSTERNFTCEICSKSFKKNSLLSRHMNTHVSEKRYKCKCGAGFKQMSNLTRHITSVHSQDDFTKKQKHPTGRKKAAKQNTKDIFETAVEYKNEPISTNDGLVLADDGVSPESRFTVFDSQLIQLVPSALQFGENLQSVAIINSDLTGFTIPTGYTITHSEEAIVDANDIDHEVFGSQSFSELPSISSEHSKNGKKKNFNVDIAVPELGYETINETGPSPMQTTDGTQSSMKEPMILQKINY